jgi:hypothetical protein
MAQEQDSLYETTYEAYGRNDFVSVKVSKRYAEDNYPLSPLMPRFLFLNAIAVAKTEGQPAFIKELQDMVARYPESELATMAKDMLALMGQGAESQQGDMSSLQARRATQTTTAAAEDSVVMQFNEERNAASMVLLVLDKDEKKLNELLYELALFNFSQFMIKDFDLKQVFALTEEKSAIQVSGLEKMDEAEWYRNMLLKNDDMKAVFDALKVEIICITEENTALIGQTFSLQEYQEWLNGD